MATEVKMKTTTLTLVAATLLVGCATEPFSYLDGRRYFKAQINTYDAAVVSVDGKDYLQNPVPIEPGMRKITLQAPPVPGFRFGVDRTIELDVEPCKRYYFAAVRKNPLLPEFEPKVDYVEPIAGCDPMKK
jgi:hypothetical protein